MSKFRTTAPFWRQLRRSPAITAANVRTVSLETVPVLWPPHFHWRRHADGVYPGDQQLPDVQPEHRRLWHRWQLLLPGRRSQAATPPRSWATTFLKGQQAGVLTTPASYAVLLQLRLPAAAPDSGKSLLCNRFPGGSDAADHQLGGVSGTVAAQEHHQQRRAAHLRVSAPGRRRRSPARSPFDFNVEQGCY